MSTGALEGIDIRFLVVVMLWMGSSRLTRNIGNSACGSWDMALLLLLVISVDTAFYQ